MKNKIKTYTNEAWEIMPKKNETVDYLWFVTKSSTKEQRAKFDIGDIFINAAVCKHCGSYIRSKNRHDYVTCACGRVSVDGGSWYEKRVGFQEDRIDIVEYFYDVTLPDNK